MAEIVGQAIVAVITAYIAVILNFRHAVVQHIIDDGQQGEAVPITGHELGKAFYYPKGRLVIIKHAGRTPLVQNGVFERMGDFMSDQALQVFTAAVAVDHHPVVARFGETFETAGRDKAWIKVGLFKVRLLVIKNYRRFFLDNDI